MSKNLLQNYFGKKFWIKILFILLFLAIERGKRKYMMLLLLLCQQTQHQIMC
jgi:hypothetical protein